MAVFALRRRGPIYNLQQRIRICLSDVHPEITIAMAKPPVTRVARIMLFPPKNPACKWYCAGNILANTRSRLFSRWTSRLKKNQCTRLGTACYSQCSSSGRSSFFHI
nr:hypothetical protein CFP56_77403 [Quercus suber]